MAQKSLARSWGQMSPAPREQSHTFHISPGSWEGGARGHSSRPRLGPWALDPDLSSRPVDGLGHAGGKVRNILSSRTALLPPHPSTAASLHP